MSKLRNLTLKPNYRTLLIGVVATVILAFILGYSNVIVPRGDNITRPIFLLMNGVSFILCWMFISILMTRFSVQRVLYGISLIAVATLADDHLPISKNPITMPILLLFWLGVGYLIQPHFFKKYRSAILSVSGLLMCYYFLHFLTTPNYGPGDRGNFSNVVLLSFTAFVALWGYEQWRWLKTLKSDKVNAELALLKSQINPHFFFNTLNNLYGLVVENSDQAPKVVLKLSDMMRYTIYEGKKEHVSLMDEIKYLETYIELHKIRYQKKVEIQFTHKVDGTIQVAPLLFIILLENAFKHGVEKVRENAFIHLSLKSEGKHVSFIIENNFKKSKAAESVGIGLDNLKRRLEYLYPDRHELILDQSESIFKARLNLILI